jgi:hypothetical protein
LAGVSTNSQVVNKRRSGTTGQGGSGVYDNNILCTLHSHSITSCLAHIINLATQAVIAAQSKTKHFNPADPDSHEPEVDTFIRDEVGLIRAITVKVSHRLWFAL